MTEVRHRKQRYEKGKESQENAEQWKSLGLCPELCTAVARVWRGSKPTPVQAKAIPVGISGADIIGIAETGSGKTGAFVLPTLQKLLELHTEDDTKTKQLFCIALAPTRELVVQIASQFMTLGEEIGVRVCTLIGGSNNMLEQSKMLAKNPHIIVASPGRINDHINNTTGFKSQLKTVRVLIFDEADRLLSLDFEDELNVILAHFKRKNKPQTFLYSATMTKNVEKLERVAMADAVTVQVADAHTMPENLVQWMKVLPNDAKLKFLAALVEKKRSKSMIIFCNTAQKVVELNAFLGELNFASTCIYGKLLQQDRLKNLEQFTTNRKKILVTTEVSARGIDIPNVDFVLNFDVPFDPKDYMHRVGRTARAGRHGESLILVTQYDLHDFINIEAKLYPEVDGKPSGRLNSYQEVSEADMQAVQDKVLEAYSGAVAATANKKDKIYAKNHKKRRTK